MLITVRAYRVKTAVFISMIWSDFRISFTDLKLGTPLYSIINGTTGKDCSTYFL